MLKHFLLWIIEEMLFPFMLLFFVMRVVKVRAKFPAYKDRVSEWLGRYPFTLQNAIWIHAVSGGEVITVKPIIEQCLIDFPGKPILVTTMTPTGAMQVERLFGSKVHYAFVPYDVPHCVTRFMKAMQPSIAIFVETEVWPELLYQCKQRSIPAYLINARLSEKSFKRYKRVKWLLQGAFESFTHIAVQTQIEADRFYQLGVSYDKMTVTGSLKFDVVRTPALFQAADELRKSLGRDRFVWCAASTHPSEEEIVLAAHQVVLKSIPNALLILVPKHPDRFSEVAVLCAKYGHVAKRSKLEMPSSDTSIYLGDTLGELVLLYAAADVAFVGGSLIAHGGHNLLEPASVKRAVISGSHLHNFQAISQWLLDAHALTLANDAASLASAVLYLEAHPEECKAQGERAEKVCVAHRGAFEKQYAMLKCAIAGV